LIKLSWLMKINLSFNNVTQWQKDAFYISLAPWTCSLLDRYHQFTVTCCFQRQGPLHETLIPVYQNTWCHIPEDHNLNIHYCENIRRLEHFFKWLPCLSLQLHLNSSKSLLFHCYLNFKSPLMHINRQNTHFAQRKAMEENKNVICWW
jgi:hypothetical protein